MVKFNFSLSESDFERLYAIKKQRGLTDLSGNEFAAELLHNLLIDLCPNPYSCPDVHGSEP